MDNLSVFDPASPPADSIRALFYLVLGVTGAIFLIVEGMIVYCIVRFRQKAGAAEPPQVYGSRPIEVAWTLAPLLIVFVLFLVVVRTVAEVRDVPPNALRITVVGHQWWWEYEYYETLPSGELQRIRTANELHIPVNRPVFLELKSADVVHSFWVPRLAGKTDVFPGRAKPNRMWFEAREEGLFLGQCAEFCGAQHANMLIRVVVQPPEAFDRWLQEQKEDAREPATGKALRGQKRFLATACVDCHTIRGTAARGEYGPDLTHLASRDTLATIGTIPMNPENLRAWVKDPQQLKPGCKMPSMHLSEADVDLITEYLETLK